MTNKIDAVFTQRSDVDGLTTTEIMKLLEHLGLDCDEEVYPVIINGDNAMAFGWIRNEVVSRILDDDVGANSPFAQNMLAVINNTDLESADQIYDFAGVRTLMYY